MGQPQSVPLPELGTRPWVAYAGPFSFPWGQAGSRRVAGIAASILATGRDVVVLSGAEPEGSRLIDQHDSGSRLWLVGTGEGLAETGAIRRNLASHVTAGAAAARWLDGQPVAPSHVVVYGGGLSYAARLSSWARRSHVSIVADVVEWYSPRQFRGGVASPSWISTQLALRLSYPRFDGVIAISQFLRRRFEGRGFPVATIPPTLDVSAVPVHERVSADPGRTGLVLCYFGTPGKKDLLPQIVEGFLEARSANSHSQPISLVIAGPTEGEVAAAAGGVLPPGVRVVGPLPQQEVGSFVRAADFSVLLRPRATYSAAGFPTKFVESLANGTPVIANLTSDLSSYLSDGSVGFVADGPDGPSLARAITRAAALAAAERAEMRARARQAALDGFDYRVHVHAVDALLRAATL